MKPEEPAQEVPACLRCGTCCFSTLRDYVRVTGADHARLGAHAEELTHFVGNRAYMNMVDGHCEALQIVVGAPGTAQFVCGAYDLRPQTCRDLSREGRACLGEIASKSGRPLLALLSLVGPR